MTAAAIGAFARGQPVAGDADASALSTGRSTATSPLDKLNAFLDTPILDTNTRGGPLEPLKRFARSEPELAQVGASATAVAFFAGLGTLLLRAWNGV